MRVHCRPLLQLAADIELTTSVQQLPAVMSGSHSAVTAEAAGEGVDEGELSGWLQLFWPTVVTMLVRIGMGLTDQAFVGHLTNDDRFPGEYDRVPPRGFP
eukprot:SAG11_NODE_373_length_10031_cov_37.400020_8_plen_100_part_00